MYILILLQFMLQFILQTSIGCNIKYILVVTVNIFDKFEIKILLIYM